MPAIYHEGSWLGNATDPEVLVKDTVGWTGKNLYDCIATSATDGYGLTWTVDATDKNIITVSGTPTGFRAFPTYSNNVLPTGRYILSGILENTTNITINYLGLRNGTSIVRELSRTLVDTEFYFDIPENVTYDNIYVTLKRNDNNVACSGTIKLMIRKVDITDPTYEPYHESVEEEIEQIYADNGVLGAKNLLEVTANTQTLGGVTFTVNRDSDGNVINVTVNGTASANTSFVLRTKTPLAVGKSYIMSRGGVGDADFQMVATAWNNGSYVKNIIDIGAGGYTEKSFVADYNGYNDIQISIFVRSGKTISNAIVYPMIRLASDPDDTYVPHAMTNRELTEKLYFQAGEMVDVTGSSFAAFISSGATEIVFTIPLHKDLSRVTGISFASSTRLSVRTPSGGYILDTVAPSAINLSIRKMASNMLSLSIKKQDGTAFDNITNNSLLNVAFTMNTSIITFS